MSERWRQLITAPFGVEIALAPKDKPPFPVKYQVFEEERYLLLSPNTRTLDESKPREWLLNETLAQKPQPLGSVLVQGQHLLAVVIDLDLEPICQPRWVEAAFKQLWAQVNQREIQSLSVPLLGTVHGELDWYHSLRLFWQTLKSTHPKHLRWLWLIVPEAQQIAIRHRLVEMYIREN